MFYVNPKGKYEKRYRESDQNKNEKVQLTIQYILVIPPHQRSDNDHQQVFYYFKNHQFFSDIERLKSLRARILCVSSIQLIQQELLKSQQFIILQKFQKSKQMAVISQQKKDKIILEDQTFIKQNMTKLKEYSLIKRLGYNQTLYLSCFLQESNPKFKEYLYKQNQQVNSNFIYFIESGQYQILKNIQFNPEILQNSRLRKKTSKSKLEKYVQFQQSPYKMKKKLNKYQQVYNLEGGYGQIIGQIQFFLEKQLRVYAVKCKSSTNKILKCQIKYFKAIFQSNGNLFKKIKFQIQERQNFQEKNIEIRATLKESKSKKKFNLGKYISEIQNNELKKFSFDFKSNLSQQKNYKTFQNQYQVAHSPSNHYRYVQNQQKKPEATAFTLQDNLLPQIDKFKQYRVAKRKEKRFPGLIDSTSLIKEKQSVIKKKKYLKQLDHQIFHFDPKKQIKNHIVSSKSAKNQDKGLAHSKIYMKNLLVDALKKSGYINEDQITQKISFNNETQKERLKYKIQSMTSTAHQRTYELIIQLEKKTQKQLQQRAHHEQKLLNKKERRSLASNNFDRFFFKLS